MDKPTCETCRWWRFDTRLNSLGDSGSCLRYAPRPITRLYSEWTDDDDAAGNLAYSLEVVWPMTFVDNWCGEHAPKEPADAE